MGVALPMTLSHRMLGQLVGARRPTVSTALSELAKEGEVARRDDGTWLLTSVPVGMPAPELERVIPMRRRLLPQQPAEPVERIAEPAPVLALAPAPAEELKPVQVRGVELRTVLEHLRERARAELARMHTSFEASAELARRSDELRARCRETRLGHGEGAERAHDAAAS